MPELLQSPYLILFARLALGGVLVMGAIGKFLDARNSADAVAQQVPLLPAALARPAAVLLPWVELALGTLLIIGLGLFPAGLAALALLIFFTAIVARDVVGGRRNACSCFGRFSTENVSEWTVARDLFLVALAFIIVLSGSRYLALDALLGPASATGPPIAEAILVALLAGVTVFAVVLGGQLASTVRGLRRLY